MIKSSNILILLSIILVCGASANSSPFITFKSFLNLTHDISESICAPSQEPPIEPAPSTSSTNSSDVTVESSSGNCTNNLTVSSKTIATRAPSTNEEQTQPEDDPDSSTKLPIVTFDEWTKEKLKQEQLRASAAPNTATDATITGNVPVALPNVVASPNTRNYASRECGAKVIASNSEAENTKAVLSDKEKDEYMRNPCNKADNKFVVVELCETIQPQFIEIGNFELFSSGPREVRVWGSERFPHGDWELFSAFNASDSRQLQKFPVSSHSYAKFVKLELVSHYGNEHYCTVSVLKVLGMSMVDEYELQAQAGSNAIIQDVLPSVESTIKPEETKDKEEQQKVAVATEKEVEKIPKDDQNTVVVEKTKVEAKETKNDTQAVVVKKKRVLPAFDAGLCRVCPTSHSCIVPTHLCWVFIWRPQKSVNSFVNESHFFDEYAEKRHLRLRRRALIERELVKSKRKTTKGQNAPADVKEQVKAIPPEVTVESPSTTPEKKSQTVPIQPQESIPAASVSHKESVFLKLNKRIASLELNMTLSSEYLSELSRQYVAQAAEHQKHLEQAKKAAHEIAREVEVRLNQTIIEKVQAMRVEMDSLLTSMRTAVSSIAFPFGPSQRFKGEDYEPVTETTTPASTQLEHYSYRDEDEQLWTTDQLMLTVLFSTVTVFLLSVILTMHCYRNHVNVKQLDALVEQKLAEALAKRATDKQEEPDSLSQTSTSSTSAAKEKKRQKRHRQRERQRERLSQRSASEHSDATTLATTSQTETSSEAELNKPHVHLEDSHNLPLTTNFHPQLTPVSA